ncbi:hypothetical protein CCB80_06775 [Armatimonadetes bacterium Uphvl-Ar1]|nr:hypothetical protein CCB80_06775 [Armatimonadetes bacterium Uphvl-Ar1]
MKTGHKPILIAIALTSLSGIASAQVPDLLNALDTGGRAMGLGGATRVTDATTQSALDNPAGLAYITAPTASITFRNLPKSSTIASGEFNDRTTDFSERSGRTALAHAGYAFPFRGGTLAVSYTVAGHLDNVTTGNQLSNGALTVNGLVEESRAQTDFFTVAYGRPAGAGMNIGIGVIIANQYTKFTQNYTLFNGNNPVGNTAISGSSNGLGLGFVAGVQGTLDAEGSSQYGISIRTPINLNNNAETSSVYDVIPGKASLGFAGQLQGVGKGRDYMIWATQFDYYFGGEGGARFSRDNTFAYGLGIEYNLHRFDARIPIRLGFQGVPAGGDGFSSRNALTFGLGYNPSGKPYYFDLNFARSLDTGKFDIGLGFTYKPAP